MLQLFINLKIIVSRERVKQWNYNKKKTHIKQNNDRVTLLKRMKNFKTFNLWLKVDNDRRQVLEENSKK